ncbi:hypothetical protein [Streptomyces sp. NPDC048659]|uniref:hypothetical protein n=1 Tax=Streptomyces sp. NPDC048659 TaxID=3155489 RepID=UPI003414FC89
MDVSTLILLGAAGGLLRGALDVYTRFVSWQEDRRAHRQSAAPGTASGEPPRFPAYFDPVVDAVAAVVHGVMGAGAAVLFGTTGQISGGYAALVVGISAPMLLTQLGRVQTVNEAVTGERQPAEPVPEPAAPQAASPVATAPPAVATPSPPPAPSPSPSPPASPSASASADQGPDPAGRERAVRPGAPPGAPHSPTAPPRAAHRQAVTDSHTPDPAPRWRQGRALGEEAP